jgi:hypothetical protein
MLQVGSHLSSTRYWIVSVDMPLCCASVWARSNQSPESIRGLRFTMVMHPACTGATLRAVNLWFTLKSHHLDCEGANPERSHYPTTLLLLPPCRGQVAAGPSLF